MLKDITLGQFFPGDSLIHKLDPRVKIIASVLYIVALFLSSSVTPISVMLVLTAVLIIVSGIPIKIILKSLKPILIILIFTTAYQLFLADGETLILKLGFIEIYLEGIIYAVLLAVRIICLLTGSSVILTYTTSPIMLTDGIERLLSPLSKIGLHVHEFAMMMTIALRFIPTLIDETDKIINAQKARGTDFSSGGLLKRAKALIPILIPLFISAFRRATDLATAMECRCYRGGKGRTRMTQLKFKAGDYTALVLAACIVSGVVILNIYFPIYSF